LSFFLLPRLGVFSSFGRRLGIHCAPTPLPDARDVRGRVGNLCQKWMGRAQASACWKRRGLGCPDEEVQRGERAPTCMRTRVNRAAGTGVQTRVSI
jgi:hypothetical protein